MGLQKKSLEHVSKTLNSFDSYEVYSAITSSMRAEGVDDKIVNVVMKSYQEAMSAENKKVQEAKGWIEAILEDIK